MSEKRRELGRAIAALYLECPQAVVDDVSAKVDALIDEYEARIDSAMEALDEINGITADTMPTLIGEPTIVWWYDYLERADRMTRDKITNVKYELREPE